MKSFSDAYHDAERASTILRGLASAMRDLAAETNAINHSDCEANTLMSLILTVDEKVADLDETISQVWAAHRAEKEQAA